MPPFGRSIFPLSPVISIHPVPLHVVRVFSSENISENDATSPIRRQSTPTPNPPGHGVPIQAIPRVKERVPMPTLQTSFHFSYSSSMIRRSRSVIFRLATNLASILYRLHQQPNYLGDDPQLFLLSPEKRPTHDRITSQRPERQTLATLPGSPAPDCSG